LFACAPRAGEPRTGSVQGCAVFGAVDFVVLSTPGIGGS
jgi:hypothetical protein